MVRDHPAQLSEIYRHAKLDEAVLDPLVTPMSDSHVTSIIPHSQFSKDSIADDSFIQARLAPTPYPFAMLYGVSSTLSPLHRITPSTMVACATRLDHSRQLHSTDAPTTLT